jgi:hypothetical protein
MRVAVITPYVTEPLDVLSRCHLSVVKQSYPCRHVMIADGPPQAPIDGWDCEHISLPGPHLDYGSTPRFVGAFHAVSQGYDAIAFLDADNWYRDDHIQSLVALHQRTGASFISSGRTLCRPDGSVIGECPYTDPDRFLDTSCMMFVRPAFPILSYWVRMPSYAQVICDRCMVHYVKTSGVPRAHTGEPTMLYTCGKAGIYRHLGERPPAGVVEAPDYQVAFAKWAADGNPPLM